MMEITVHAAVAICQEPRKTFVYTLVIEERAVFCLYARHRRINNQTITARKFI